MRSYAALTKRLMTAWPTGWLMRIVVVVGLTGAVLAPQASSADEGPGDDVFAGVTAVAEARGASINYTMPGFIVVEEFIDGGGPVAQSTVSPGTRKAFASLPYPGAAAIGFPGIFAFLSGVVPPGYPLFVSASDPTQPEQTLGDPSGPYALSAAAHRDRAVGDALARWLPGDDKSASRASSHTEITSAGDKVTAQALSVANAITIGPLSIASLRSESISTYQSGADKPETHTAMTIEGGRVGEMSFRFGDSGLVVADHGVPIPAGEGLTALNTALKPAGLTVRFQAVSPVEGGAKSAAFEVVHVASVPSAGTGTFVVRFGGVRSAVIPLGESRDAQRDPQATSAPAAVSGGSGTAPPSTTWDGAPGPVAEPSLATLPGVAIPALDAEATSTDASPVASQALPASDEFRTAPLEDSGVASTHPAGALRRLPRQQALPPRLVRSSSNLGGPRVLAWLLAFAGLMSVLLLAVARRVIGRTTR